MPLSTRSLAAAAALILGIAIVYWQVLVRLVDAWSNDGNYSHGFLIVPIAAFLAWERRARLQAAPIRPSAFGLVVFLGGILLLLAGLLGSELFVSRVSLIVATVGVVLFLFGWEHVRILAFPFAFLFLMIPLPAIIFNQIAFPLQLLASEVGEWAISSAGVPVLREGNVLILANTSLEVAEACSGIRSLVSLITLGIVYGYFIDSRAWVRVLIVLSTIPVAILSNAARVAGTGILAHYWGPEAADGFFHEFSGWIVFIVAFVLILAIRWAIVRVAPEPPAPASLATV
jgi:exosortase